MIFGIDLGTTNSLIGNGEDLFSGLVSSTVDLTTREVVPHECYGEGIVASYKTDMGLGVTNAVARECSVVVLQKLASIAERRTGEECKEVCISVPAYFSSTQRQAVRNSAEKAGLTVRRIINEPVAAAIAICQHNKDYVCVYDLGGGTFDVTLIDAREGIFTTVATDGMVLGGDDFDEALRKHIIQKAKIPIRKRKEDAMCELLNRVRKAKLAIQRGDTEYEIDLSFMDMNVIFTLTREDYKKIAINLFQSTLEKTLTLIEKYVPTYDLEHVNIIYTGGSTYCPILREWLAENIHLNEIDYDIPRDKLVATGIAIVAKMVEDGTDESLIVNVTKRLSLKLRTGATVTVFDENTVIPAQTKLMLNNSEETDEAHIDVYQGNSIFADYNEYIGTLAFKYQRVMPPGLGVISVTITVSYDGIVDVSAHELTQGIESSQHASFKLNEIFKSKE